jgi:cysteine desulfurase
MHRVGTEEFGNPSSLHEEGKRARSVIETARRRCADSLNTDPDRLVFTSGGTESNAIPLSGLLNLRRRARICISQIEHPAVWEFTRTFRHFGFDVQHLQPDRRGIVTPEEVEKHLSPDTAAVALMAVNNETGAVQPVEEVVSRIRRYERDSGVRIRVHCDAVQGLGKIPLVPDDTGVDTMAFSAHKLGGPKGVGLLYCGSPLQILSPAGGQENGLRGGTENVAAIHALSLAVERGVAAIGAGTDAVRTLRTETAARLAEMQSVRLLPEASVDEPEKYSPFILAFSVAPVPGEVLVRVMNDRGFAVSTGSACSASSRKKQHRVLKAMGTGDDAAAGAVRISFGPDIERQHLDDFCATLQRELPLLRKTAGMR